jgi:hypothetical protein
MSGVIPSKQVSFIGAGNGATDMDISNPTLTLANTEYSISLQNGLKQLIISSRTRATLKCTLAAGESGSKYKTIYYGGSWHMVDLDFTGKTLYIQSDVPSTVVEIVEYT